MLYYSKHTEIVDIHRYWSLKFLLKLTLRFKWKNFTVTFSATLVSQTFISYSLLLYREHRNYDCLEFACCVNVFFSEVQTVMTIDTYVILYCCHLLFLSITTATIPYSCMMNHRIISRRLLHWIGTNVTNYLSRI